MAKGSGLLSGRGCYDSIRKCENDTSVFLSIRNHGTPFIVEQRQVVARARAAESIDHNYIETRVKEQLKAGNFPFLLKFFKYVFMLLFFPLNFLFDQLPRFIFSKVLTPLFRMLQKIWQVIVPPCVRVILAIYRPIASLCKKIVQLSLKLIKALKPPVLAMLRVLGKCLFVFKPLVRILPKKRSSSGRSLLQKCAYGVKVSFIWVKLLISHGFSQAKDHVKSKNVT